MRQSFSYSVYPTATGTNPGLLTTTHQDLKSEPDLLVEIITRTTASPTQWGATSTDAATESVGSEWAGR